ncbi:hypothetical protein SIAM614_00877 [Stappia aggregata IAM 12614]|uniref:Uncharacterized protein n=1 Tax=Roseibium aggregatum (strain ATCC 25650 / DSM 13394 / JCM 20685 / NBRC 16684 / NCIMB 2208 / IAM 12614 / B1) TaxID=384765 RepID=A0P2U8_ROSAI|nr:hypothetical protein SIAM614_00877 [Stappia aggregata IAM 12614] [Roseibium aggregatum IAM 12614]
MNSFHFRYISDYMPKNLTCGRIFKF